jgi:hypothetical protein
LENIGHKKGQPSGSKQKEHQEASKEGKKKWKGGKDKKTTNTAHQCKDPNNHCNIDWSHRGKVLETTSIIEPKEPQEGSKEKESSSHNSSNQVERNSDVDEKIVCTSCKRR